MTKDGILDLLEIKHADNPLMKKAGLLDGVVDASSGIGEELRQGVDRQAIQRIHGELVRDRRALKHRRSDVNARAEREKGPFQRDPEFNRIVESIDAGDEAAMSSAGKRRADADLLETRLKNLTDRAVMRKNQADVAAREDSGIETSRSGYEDTLNESLMAGSAAASEQAGEAIRRGLNEKEVSPGMLDNFRTWLAKQTDEMKAWAKENPEKALALGGTAGGVVLGTSLGGAIAGGPGAGYGATIGAFSGYPAAKALEYLTKRMMSKQSSDRSEVSPTKAYLNGYLIGYDESGMPR